jgi:hypothetical protein
VGKFTWKPYYFCWRYKFATEALFVQHSLFFMLLTVTCTWTIHTECTAVFALQTWRRESTPVLRHITLPILFYSITLPVPTVWGVGLLPSVCRDRGFEFHRGGMNVCLLWVFVLSGRGLCDGPIPRPEESYRLWCVSECDRVKIHNLDTCCEQVGKRGKDCETKCRLCRRLRNTKWHWR